MFSWPPIPRAMIRGSCGTLSTRRWIRHPQDMTGVEQIHKGQWSLAYDRSWWTAHKWTIFRGCDSNWGVWGQRSLWEHYRQWTSELRGYCVRHLLKKHLRRWAKRVCLSKDGTTGSFRHRWQLLLPGMLRCSETVRSVQILREDIDERNKYLCSEIRLSNYVSHKNLWGGQLHMLLLWSRRVRRCPCYVITGRCCKDGWY